MAAKLPLKTYPAGHGPDDFQCFGPAATEDDAFEGTKIADMACFAQRDEAEAKAAGKAVDSNKYYHGAVVQSRLDQSWYFYVEYGRVGTKASFQFTPASSSAEAEKLYVKQMKSKNIGRGRWENHSVLGNRLVPKSASKDLYIVSPQATRATGLPDAKTITSDEGLDKSKVKKKTTTAKGKKKPKVDVDSQTIALMRDLNVATVKYTKASMAGAALPTQSGIDRGRLILTEALKCVKRVGSDVGDQVNDRELIQLTRDMYGLIPKKKDRGAAPETWILSQDNISMWQQDLDAFESALYVADLGDVEVDNPLGDLPLKMTWLSPQSERGEFIHNWMPNASRNVHYGIGAMKVKNVWQVDRNGDDKKLTTHQESVVGRWRTDEKPLHQPAKRIDLSRDEQKLFVRSGTHMFFHGTRSVNVSGILRESLRLPKQLVGVAITGAMFGPGMYWADDWRKSAGYTSLRGSYWSGGSGSVARRGAFMFVADVCIGKPFVAPGPRGYTSPPKGYHSVFGKGRFAQAGSSQNSGVQNNEFITYERESHRLRYLVEFDTK